LIRPSQKIGLGLLVFLLACLSHAQDLPSSIRGYKVYNANIVISDKADGEPSVRLIAAKITGMGLTGSTVEVGAELVALDRAGDVKFMTFKDFTVNGIPFEIEEYTESFSFKKGDTVALKKPARLTLKTTNIARGALKELTDPKATWAVSGTVFVFGKFKKFGFMFKRVIPVKVSLTMKNPIRTT
jgi:hypothetical protein